MPCLTLEDQGIPHPLQDKDWCKYKQGFLKPKLQLPSKSQVTVEIKKTLGVLKNDREKNIHKGSRLYSKGWIHVEQKQPSIV